MRVRWDTGMVVFLLDRVRRGRRGYDMYDEGDGTGQDKCLSNPIVHRYYIIYSIDGEREESYI